MHLGIVPIVFLDWQEYRYSISLEGLVSTIKFDAFFSSR